MRPASRSVKCRRSRTIDSLDRSKARCFLRFLRFRSPSVDINRASRSDIPYPILRRYFARPTPEDGELDNNV